jgi:hypothetical protein
VGLLRGKGEVENRAHEPEFSLAARRDAAVHPAVSEDPLQRAKIKAEIGDGGQEHVAPEPGGALQEELAHDHSLVECCREWP